MAVRVVGGSWGARGAGGLLCRPCLCALLRGIVEALLCFGGGPRRARAPGLYYPLPRPRARRFFFSPDFFCVSSLYIEKNHSTLQRGMLHTHRSRAFRGRGERAPCLAGRV